MATGVINKPYPIMLVEEKTVDNISVTASETQTLTIPCGKEGYTPIGIVGFQLANASSSGARVSFVFVFAVYLNTTDPSVKINVRNTNSSAAKVLARAWVLYKKN